jgi:hypothetical protein
VKEQERRVVPNRWAMLLAAERSIPGGIRFSVWIPSYPTAELS